MGSFQINSRVYCEFKINICRRIVDTLWSGPNSLLLDLLHIPTSTHHMNFKSLPNCSRPHIDSSSMGPDFFVRPDRTGVTRSPGICMDKTWYVVVAVL